MAVEIIRQDFEEKVLRSELPVVVDFKAAWCGYCKRLAPVIDRLEEAYRGKLRVAMVDVDELAALTEKYGVDTYPTLILFKDGKPGELLVNPPSQAAIEEWLRAGGIQ